MSVCQSIYGLQGKCVKAMGAFRNEKPWRLAYIALSSVQKAVTGDVLKPKAGGLIILGMGPFESGRSR